MRFIGQCALPVTMMKVFCKCFLRAVLLTQLRDIYSHLNAQCRLLRGDQKSACRFSEAVGAKLWSEIAVDLDHVTSPLCCIPTFSSSLLPPPPLWFKVLLTNYTILGQSFACSFGSLGKAFLFYFSCSLCQGLPISLYQWFLLLHSFPFQCLLLVEACTLTHSKGLTLCPQGLFVCLFTSASDSILCSRSVANFSKLAVVSFKLPHDWHFGLVQTILPCETPEEAFFVGQSEIQGTSCRHKK